GGLARNRAQRCAVSVPAGRHQLVYRRRIRQRSHCRLTRAASLPAPKRRSVEWSSPPKIRPGVSGSIPEDARFPCEVVNIHPPRRFDMDPVSAAMLLALIGIPLQLVRSGATDVASVIKGQE